MSQFRGVLVTGGAGFIGSHVVDALLTRGERVTILDNLTPKIHPRGLKPEYVPGEARFVLGDVRDPQAWCAALEGCDAVVHLAAYQDYNLDFSTFFSVNSVSTALLFELILERRLSIARVVVASSQAVYGEGVYRCKQHGDVRPDSRPRARLDRGAWEQTCPQCGEEVEPIWVTEAEARPANQYGLSKLDQERIALVLGRLHGIAASALRYSIVQGTRQSPYNTYSGALRTFAIRAACDSPPIVFEDGAQLRDYVNIKDAVSATLIALTHPQAVGQAFNVGGGKGVRVHTLAEAVIRILDKRLEPEVPGLYRVGDTRHILSDVSGLAKLGWTPTTSLEDSVREYATWLVGSGRLRANGVGSVERMLESGVIRRVVSAA